MLEYLMEVLLEKFLEGLLKKSFTKLCRVHKGTGVILLFFSQYISEGSLKIFLKLSLVDPLGDSSDPSNTLVIGK